LESKNMWEMAYIDIYENCVVEENIVEIRAVFKF
jgi:hypothetical protein